jgi:flagellin-like hook-associated protein FlgL
MHNVEDKVTRAFPKIGGRISTLTTLQNSLESIKYNTEDEISRLQDADIAQVAVDLAKHELLYEMSLVVASKMFSLSLMNFLR